MTSTELVTLPKQVVKKSIPKESSAELVISLSLLETNKTLHPKKFPIIRK